MQTTPWHFLVHAQRDGGKTEYEIGYLTLTPANNHADHLIKQGWENVCFVYPCKGMPSRSAVSKTYDTPNQLAAALKRAADAHHIFEQQTGKPDPDWASWYAEFLLREAQ